MLVVWYHNNYSTVCYTYSMYAQYPIQQYVAVHIVSMCSILYSSTMNPPWPPVPLSQWQILRAAAPKTLRCRRTRRDLGTRILTEQPIVWMWAVYGRSMFRVWSEYSQSMVRVWWKYPLYLRFQFFLKIVVNAARRQMVQKSGLPNIGVKTNIIE